MTYYHGVHPYDRQAHSTASILSLQGATPLPGHPKTLRDLTHTTQFLTLPSSFGSIQLGETFSSCLCVNNEAQVDISGFNVKVEIQTASTKLVLADLGGPACRIASGSTFESIVTHEIKELGQHVLACTVTYQLPLTLHPSLASAESTGDMSLQTFRKFYKFAVTNPLSVKTKVHIPRSPTALMLPKEREKVFLEVHIQNLTSDSLHFERMKFECTDGWNVTDTNVSANTNDESLFSGSQAVMQPQDTRQYIYILTPKSIPRAPVISPPGSIIPLGRLDIFWRSSFGEPGRLLTSMLSRRIPLLVPVPQAMSTLPSYVKRTIAAIPSRPQSPQPIQSRPGTPSFNQVRSPSQSHLSLIGVAGPQPTISPHDFDIEVSLVRDVSSPTSVLLQKPFDITFSLYLSAPMHPGKKTQFRTLRIALQHLQHRQASDSPHLLLPAPSMTLSSRLSSGFSTPSSPHTTFRHAADQKLMGSPQHTLRNEIEMVNDSIALPPPFFSDADGLNSRRSTGVVFTGSSTLLLPPVELSVLETGAHSDAVDKITKLQASQRFQLSYVARQRGYMTIGGLRVLLVGDSFVETGKNAIHDGEAGRVNPAATLKEWDVVGEVWAS